MRSFVKLREILSTHKELAYKLKDIEMKFEDNDEKIIEIYELINQLLVPEKKMQLD